MSLLRLLSLQDGPQVDAFGRLRVSDPASVMSYSNQYDDGTSLFWEDALTATGTATHLPNESSVRLRVAASGDKVIRQTRHYHPYQPGKSMKVVITGVVSDGTTTNTRRRWGYFDANNGYFFELAAGGTFNVVRRTFTSGSAVDTAVAQSAFNVDKLDGTGPSKVTIDLTKGLVFWMDMQWLGMGRCRMGVSIPDGTTGKPHNIVCHEFLNANNLSTVHTTTATLPVRFEIEATGAPGGNVDMIATCAEVTSEGGRDFARGVPFVATNGATTRALTAQTCVLSIRPKATFNSLTNRGLIIPEEFGCYTDGNGLLQLVWNSTIGGTPAFSSVNAASIADRDIAGTTLTGGIVIAQAYVTSAIGASANSVDTQVNSPLPIALDIAGTGYTNLSLVYTPIGAGTDNVSGFIKWREIR